MTLREVMIELESMGTEQTRKIFKNHGAKEPLFGVKVGDLKKIVRKVKKDHELSLALFKTGNSDAMYLAGLIADEDQITKKQLQEWAQKANWYLISEYTVPWITAESRFGHELAMEWIESDKENMASAGWATLASLVSIKNDDELDIQELDNLLDRVQNNIHAAPNRVRYAMNGFVIALGSYVKALTNKSINTGKEIGRVKVEMGGTACKVPFSPEYIEKVKKKERIGIKRKAARC